MQVPLHVLNRLIAARGIIEDSGPEPTSVSEPLAVAKKILAAHDASELALLGLCAQLGLRPREIDGKTKAEPSFMAVVRTVVDAAFTTDVSAANSAIALFEQMNRLRVGFKHHGNLPEVLSTHHSFAEIVDTLNEMFNRLLSTPFLEVDQAIAIQDDIARTHFSNSRVFIESGEYKEALEAISRGLHQVFFTGNFRTYMKPGEASTEDALLLSGKGIDPASFLTMQKFLPITHTGTDVQWELRKNGHSENWTEDAARFCLATAISVTIRLQSAKALPQPQDFYDWFEDVVEVTAETPTVYKTRNWFGAHGEPEVHPCKLGDQFVGRATGHLAIASNEESVEIEFEHAPFIQLSYYSDDGSGLGLGSLVKESLWFSRPEIELTYRSNGWRERIQEYALQRELSEPT